MKPLRLASGFEDELREAARWYDFQRRGLGAEFIAAVTGRLDDLTRSPTSHPLIGKGASGLELRQAFVLRFPYKVI